MTKLTKKDLREPDQFIKAAKNITHYVEDHAKLITGLSLAFIILGGGYGVYDFVASKREDQAQIALFEAKKKYIDLLRAHEEATTPKDEKKGAKKKADEKTAKKEEPKATPAFSAEVVEGYRTVVASYPGSKAGTVAAVSASDYLLDYGKSEEALGMLESATTKAAGGMTSAILSLQYARVLDAAGKCDQAVTVLEGIASNPKHQQWHADALLKAGACYETLAKKDRAKEAWEKVAREFPESAASKSAKKFLRLLSFAGGT